MTWVIGLVAPGFAVGLADTRISFKTSEGETKPIREFGVQKVHRVAERMALGFAGSIQAGFLLLESFRRVAGSAPEGHLTEFVTEWIDISVAGALAELGREAITSPWGVIVLSIPLSRDWGPRPPTGLAYSEGCRVVSGGGRLEIEEIPILGARHIGSGSAVDEYRTKLEELTDAKEMVELTNFGMATRDQGLGGPGLVMGVVVTGIIESKMEPSVSADVVVCCLEREGLTLETNQNFTKRSWPPMAKTLAEFLTLAGERGIGAAEISG